MARGVHHPSDEGTPLTPHKRQVNRLDLAKETRLTSGASNDDSGASADADTGSSSHGSSADNKVGDDGNGGGPGALQ